MSKLPAPKKPPDHESTFGTLKAGFAIERIAGKLPSPEDDSSLPA
jgi:hypothetical protein